MNEFDAIFSSPAATSVFFLISAIGLSVMVAIAFGSWVRSARRRRVKRAPRAAAAAWRSAL